VTGKRIQLPGLNGPRDLLEKLRRDAALLDGEVTSDKLFNFVITAYSLIDWVKNNPTLPSPVRKAVLAMYQDPWVRVCGDLATAAKHFELDRRAPITLEAESQRGYGCGRYGKGVYGVGEEQIEVKLSDGSSIPCLELATDVIKAWDRFFTSHGL
jgi:hypothetical protein